MEKLFETIGVNTPKYLLKSHGGEDAEAKIIISVEPGHGIINAGTVMYRKANSVIYAPAQPANIVETNNLVILRDDVDTSGSDTIAVAAAAYRKGVFIAGYVNTLSGSTYTPVTAAHALILRKQGIEFAPMDDWSKEALEANNVVE